MERAKSGRVAGALLARCYRSGSRLAPSSPSMLTVLTLCADALALRCLCAGAANANDNDSHCDLGRGRGCRGGCRWGVLLRLAKSNF
jgi:hypothetical protein